MLSLASDDFSCLLLHSLLSLTCYLLGNKVALSEALTENEILFCDAGQDSPCLRKVKKRVNKPACMVKKRAHTCAGWLTASCAGSIVFQVCLLHALCGSQDTIVLDSCTAEI